MGDEMVTCARAELEGLGFQSPQPLLFFTQETPIVPVTGTGTKNQGIYSRLHSPGS